MFLSGAQTTSSSFLRNDENSVSLHRQKSLNENKNGGLGGGKKGLQFNENTMKTPHRSKKDGTVSSNAKSAKTGRRRALGDISNRKSGGLGGGANGVEKGIGKSAIKQSSKALFGANQTVKSSTGNNKVSFATPHLQQKKNLKLNTTIKPKLDIFDDNAKNGAPESDNFLLPKRASTTPSNPKRASQTPTATATNPSAKINSEPSEYDGVFGKTTRWAPTDMEEEFNIPTDELFEGSYLRRERMEKDRKESRQRDLDEIRFLDEQFEESLKMAKDELTNGFEDFGCEGEGCDADEKDLFGVSWKEENDIFDPAEERRLSGTDPYSMWGDILDS